MKLRIPAYTVVGDLPAVDKKPGRKRWSWDGLLAELESTCPGMWVRVDADVNPKSVYSRFTTMPGVEVAIRANRLCLKVEADQ